MLNTTFSRQQILDMTLAFFVRTEQETQELDNLLAKITQQSVPATITDDCFNKMFASVLADVLEGRATLEALTSRMIDEVTNIRGQEYKNQGHTEKEIEDYKISLHAFYTSCIKRFNIGNLFKLFENVITLALTKGIEPKNVFETDELYFEVLRQLHSRKDYAQTIEMLKETFSLDALFESMVLPYFKVKFAQLAELGHQMDDEVKTEAIREARTHFHNTQEAKDLVNMLHFTIDAYINEKVAKIYGSDSETTIN